MLPTLGISSIVIMGLHSGGSKTKFGREFIIFSLKSGYRSINKIITANIISPSEAAKNQVLCPTPYGKNVTEVNRVPAEPDCELIYLSEQKGQTPLL
jgi:hypothetical protein